MVLIDGFLIGGVINNGGTFNFIGGVLSMSHLSVDSDSSLLGGNVTLGFNQSVVLAPNGFLGNWG